MVFDWLDKQGVERSSGEPTSRSKALIYYKQALKYGDLKAAERYLKKYVAKGGNLKGLKGSIKRAHPLAQLKKNRRQFLETLSPSERKTFSAAVKWYKQTYGAK